MKVQRPVSRYRDQGSRSKDQGSRRPRPRLEVQRLMIEVHEFRNEAERPRIKYLFFAAVFVSTMAFHTTRIAQIANQVHYPSHSEVEGGGHLWHLDFSSMDNQSTMYMYCMYHISLN